MAELGRPSSFTQEIADKICFLIATGNKGLHRLCKENEDLPSYKTIFSWLSNPEYKDFLHQYEMSKGEQADFLADEIIEIADDGSNDSTTVNLGDGVETEIVNKENIQRSRLRVDARKWIAAKLKPKKYGEKLDLTSGGEKIEYKIGYGGDSNSKD